MRPFYTRTQVEIREIRYFNISFTF